MRNTDYCRSSLPLADREPKDERADENLMCRQDRNSGCAFVEREGTEGKLCYRHQPPHGLQTLFISHHNLVPFPCNEEHSISFIYARTLL